jgi:alcohol oxidase
MPRNTVTGEEAPKGRFISMVVTPLYSFSRGHIHITSTTDIYSTPDFDAAMLSNPLDIKAHILGYKRGREIIRRMPCFRGEWKDSHPPFPIHSTAAHSDDPVKPIRDYVYSKEDDEIIEQWIRGEIVSMNHPMYSF